MESSNRDGGIDRRVMDNIRFNARRLARGRTIPGMEVEDYEQDFVVDLLHRRKAFDPRFASFATFADRIVGHRISTMMSPTLRLKAERSTMSLDAPVPDEDGKAQTLLDLLADEALPTDESTAIRIDVGRFVESLPPHLLDYCEILLADNISEGARAAGIHRSTAYERAERLRERAAAHGLAIYVTDPSDSFARSPVDDEDQPGLSSPGLDFDQQGALTMGAVRRFPTAYLPLRSGGLDDDQETKAVAVESSDEPFRHSRRSDPMATDPAGLCGSLHHLRQHPQRRSCAKRSPGEFSPLLIVSR